MNVQTEKLSPKAKTEQKLRDAMAKRGPKDADKAKDEAEQLEAQKRELAAVLRRECEVVEKANGARAALVASITARFTEQFPVKADDLTMLYKGQAKTRENRASELNAALRTGQALGKAQAVRLLSAVDSYGSRLRDDWRNASADARRLCRDAINTGADKAVAAANAVTTVIDGLKAAQELARLREDASAAKKARDRAESDADKAHAYAAKVQDDPAAFKRAQENAKRADKAADAARERHEAAVAKLPQKAPEPPRTPDAIVQDVKALMGEAAMPEAALAALTRDLVQRWIAVGRKDIAQAIGRAVEAIK